MEHSVQLFAVLPEHAEQVPSQILHLLSDYEGQYPFKQTCKH